LPLAVGPIRKIAGGNGFMSNNTLQESVHGELVEPFAALRRAQGELILEIPVSRKTVAAHKSRSL
jgi:hypothetical protein